MIKERNMATTFKVGDRVRMTDEGVAHWGDQSSGTIGTVTPEDDEDGWVYVEWDHGRRTECYRPSIDLTLADAPASARYVVRQVADAQPDEPGVWCDGQKAPPAIAAKMNRGELVGWRFQPLADAQRDSSPGYPRVAGVIDTHDAWHSQTADATPPPAPVEPSRPSDAAVCAAWEAAARTIESGGTVPVGARLDRNRLAFLRVESTDTTLADYQAARSRELKRLAAASAERERMRVVVQCQDGEANDV